MNLDYARNYTKLGRTILLYHNTTRKMLVLSIGTSLFNARCQSWINRKHSDYSDSNQKIIETLYNSLYMLPSRFRQTYS